MTPQGDAAARAEADGAWGGADGAWGRIELRDLRALGTHGVPDEERASAQPFSVDLDVWLDTSRAAATDDLDDTVDYGRLAVVVAAVVGGPPRRLLESLAAAVADAVLRADGRILRAGATVRKLRPPVPVDLGSVGVRVVRDRAVDAHPEGEPAADPAPPRR